ncbi:MAG: hypothetical protein BWZ10_02389 [candidate division BRC1 bacterium ADurb.BinA364]|nr:MAG: hypothetical protein BWZ10_02389 [candidate division BRC1 bacterium ADurb.BinA364]
MAVVAEFDLDSRLAAGRIARPQLDIHAARIAERLNGVLNNVEKGLLQHESVAAERRQRIAGRDNDLQPALFERFGAGQVGRPARRALQVARRARGLLRFGELQQFAHALVDVVHFLGDDAQAALELVLVRRRGQVFQRARHHLRIALDRPQRILDLVRHRGRHFADDRHALRARKPLAGLAQLVVHLAHLMAVAVGAAEEKAVEQRLEAFVRQRQSQRNRHRKQDQHRQLQGAEDRRRKQILQNQIRCQDNENDEQGQQRQEHRAADRLRRRFVQIAKGAKHAQLAQQRQQHRRRGIIAPLGSPRRRQHQQRIEKGPHEGIQNRAEQRAVFRIGRLPQSLVEHPCGGDEIDRRNVEQRPVRPIPVGNDPQFPGVAGEGAGRFRVIRQADHRQRRQIEHRQRQIVPPHPGQRLRKGNRESQETGGNQHHRDRRKNEHRRIVIQHRIQNRAAGPAHQRRAHRQLKKPGSLALAEQHRRQANDQIHQENEGRRGLVDRHASVCPSGARGASASSGHLSAKSAPLASVILEARSRLGAQ